jgi:hypothetical protein
VKTVSVPTEIQRLGAEVFTLTFCVRPASSRAASDVAAEDLGRRDGRAAMLEEARAVSSAPVPQALAVARGDLLNDLASDLAKGHGPSAQRTVPDEP